MSEIAMLNPKLANQSQLIIDIVVNLPSGLHHVATLKHSTDGLHEVPLTYKHSSCPVDIHTTYHANGETHIDLTKGKIYIADGQQTQILDEAYYPTREDRGRAVRLWGAQNQSWSSLNGVEEIHPHTGFVDINSLAAGYPVLSARHAADYVFEIVAQSLPSTMISIRKFLVKPHDTTALPQYIGEIMDGWEHEETLVTWPAHERLTVEKAEVLTSLSPWLAIVVFCASGK
jgi:hypothetical protein